jgi:signal transduction histidine kinase
MRSTFSRTFSTIVITLLAAFLAIGTSFTLLVKSYLTGRVQADLKTDGEIIAQLVQSAYTEDNFTGRDFNIALSVASSISGADAVICDAKGTLLLCARAPLGCEHRGLVLDKAYLERVFAQNGATDTGTIKELYSDNRYIVAVPILAQNGGRIGIVIMSSPTEGTTAVMDRISEIFLFVSILVILISVVAMILFARQQSKPLQQMARAANAFGHGEFTARVDTEGNYPAEIEELAISFNNMASSLQKSEYRRQEFVANVSHELKTPMTTIAGYIDGILDGTIPEEKQEHYLQIVSDETKRLNRLVRSMLDISRLQDQGGIPDEQKSRFDLEESLGQVLITFEQKIMAKALEVQVDMPEHPVFTHANADYVTQVIYNLIDNAVKFCPQEGTLALSIREGKGKAYVSVANDGETIPPEELPLVFDRFHKLDKSRSQNRDSWGLGLYIVKTIVISHGENISVTSRNGQTTFTFTMPLVN